MLMYNNLKFIRYITEKLIFVLLPRMEYNDDIERRKK